VKDTRSISFTLGEDETSLLLTKVNNAFRTEINDILLTMLGMGIRKTFALDRVLIALEGHGREDILENIDISRTVGWFTGLFPVVLDLSYTDDTGRQLKENKETLRKIPYKGIGYGILRYLSGVENKKAIEFKLEPQISFNYLGQFDEELNRLSFCEIADEPVGNAQSLTGPREFDIDVSAIITDNRLSVSVFYN
ncbi:MAG: surfactin/lichenysin synthetase, partial [Acidobacteriota bacterium]|nr:surfactin/lichenysin synthetase [Acidobacteriota bacterium]